jgi:subtilisin-like proprotein convertase family protein
LYPPFAGKAQPAFIPLSVMDGGPAKGTWTLSVFNGSSSVTAVKTFGSWSLQVATHRPFAEK